MDTQQKQDFIPLSDIAEINPSRKALLHIRDNDEVSFIPMADTTESGRWINQQTRFYHEVKHGYTFFEEGDVLFAKITPCMENGKGCLATALKNQVGFASTEFHVIRANKEGDSRFIFQWSIFQNLRQKAVTSMTGSAGQQRVTASFLRQYKIPRIFKNEQTQIAAVLSTIDLAISQTEAIIAKQQRIKTALMQDLLTKGIDENGNIRSEATHEFKDSSIGRIPAEWDVAPVSKYGSKHKSYLCTGPFGSTLNTKHWVQDGVPVLTIGSLGEGELIENELLYVTELTAKNLKSFLVEPNDIVFSRVADIGRSLVIEPEQEGSIISSNLMRLSINKKKASPVYLHRNIAFNTSIVSQLRVTSNSGGRDLVNGEILSKILFPWPSFEEQNRINSVIDGIDKTISILKQELVNQNQIKTGLMQDLLTGKVRVTPLLEQEPASR